MMDELGLSLLRDIVEKATVDVDKVLEDAKHVSDYSAKDPHPAAVGMLDSMMRSIKISAKILLDREEKRAKEGQA